MHFQLLALLFFFESFFACQQAPDQKLSLSAAALGQEGMESCRSYTPVYLASDIVFQSVDAGDTWRDISAGLPEGAAPFSLLVSGDEVFLGGNGGLFRGAGALFPIWEKELMLDDEVTGIFTGHAGPYAVTHWHGFSQNLPGTGLWITKSDNLNEQSILSVLETRNGSLVVGGETGIYHSSDGGNNWKKVYEKCMVRSIVESGNVLIAGSNKGILRSADGGETWQLAMPTNNDVLSIRPIEGGFAALVEGKLDESGGRTNGYYFSSDQGLNWQNRAASLPAELGSIYALEQAGANLIACSDAGIFRSADQGKTWDKIRPAPTNKGSFYKIAVTEKAIFALLIFGC